MDCKWGWGGEAAAVAAEGWGQWRWGSGDDGEARGGEWWSRSGRSVEDLSFYIFWVRRSLAGKVAGGGGGGRNNSPEKMEGMEEEDDVCVVSFALSSQGFSSPKGFNTYTFIAENYLNFLSVDRFNDLLRACPHHGFSELHQLDTFYNALNANDQDSLNSAAGGNFLDKMPRECLRIIESKSKVRNSRNKAVVAKVSSNSSTPGISPDVAALTTEVSELKNLMKTMLIDKQKAQAPATVKAVEQSYVTCGGAHSYKNCSATDDNVYQYNIQEYVSQVAAANFNQGNTNSRPSMVSNQIRPPGFPPIQNNQNRFNQNQGNNFNQNRGTNFNQNRGSNFNQGQVYQPPTIQTPVYQAPTQQMQGVSKTDFKNYVKANDAVLRNMQNQGQGPSTPLVPTLVASTSLKEPEQNPETSMDKVQKPGSESTAQVPPPEDHDSIFNEILKPKTKETVQEHNSPKPNSYQPKLPYPERMKVREKDKPSAQQSRFMKLFKQLRLEIGSGYHQKDRKPSQNDKTEHGMEKTVQNIKAKSKWQVRVNVKNQQSKTEPELKNTVGMQS
ncbi:hypothetical protein Tco_0150122 [Tanacetum coccineum]